MISTEKQAEVVAFVVDRDYKRYESYQGLPVVLSDDLESIFPPKEFEICLSFAYKNMVHNRKDIYMKCKRKGYIIYTFVSRNAVIYTNCIGEGCNIYPGVVLSPFVTIGEGTFIDAGCVIAHHTEIGDFNYMAPGTRFCGEIRTGSTCFFGAASIVNNGCKIGNDVFVASNAKVTKNIEDRKTVLTKKIKGFKLDSFDAMKMMFEN